MSSSTAVPNDTQLAAETAHSSLKRARLLFQTPTWQQDTLQDIDAAALERRLRQRTGVTRPTTTNSNSQTESSAMVVKPPSFAETSLALKTFNKLNENIQQQQQNPPKVDGILTVATRESHSAVNVPRPTWHPPFKLAAVLSSHLGWVRSIAIDQTNNQWMATGSADRTIKLWNLPKASVGSESALQLTLTGHISPVRGLAFDPHHPYLFSAAEDKRVCCWDLETNQVIRYYHGHLSGVFCLSLFPNMPDILVSGGRDAVARVWDMRSKTQIHCLSGHENTVGSILTQSLSPHIITGSYDNTIKMWDLVAGKVVTTLTHHQKAVRALCQPTFERTFCSGAADCLKQWQGKNGRLIQNLSGHKAIINALAVNDDGVMVSGGDDGSLNFWDYKTGYNYQQEQSKVQPGSLEAENGIMALSFDMTGTRLITGETDKTIKIYKPDDDASELTHPIDMVAWRKKCVAKSKERY